MEHCGLAGFKAREHQEGEEKGGIYTDQQVKTVRATWTTVAQSLSCGLPRLLGEQRTQERRCRSRCCRPQKPDKHTSAHMDGNSGQREAAAEEQDSKIWNHFTDK